MKNTTRWILGLLMMAALALTACSKSSGPLPPPTINGVTVDMPKLREAFANASPELQNQVSQVAMGLRYGDYASTLKALDALAGNASLTEPQKKAVADVTDQVKQLAAKAKPAQ